MERHKDFYFQWHITNKCNLKCIHCYGDNCIAQDLRLEDLSQIAKALNSALESWGKIGHVSISGGEPFYDLAALAEAIKLLDRSSHIKSFGVLTNGTLVSDEAVAILKRAQKLSDVQISLDGGSEATHDKIRGKGAFQSAQHGIRVLVTHGFRATVMCTLNNINISEVEAIFDLSSSLQVSSLTFERWLPLGQSARHDYLKLTRDSVHRVFTDIALLKLKASEVDLHVNTDRPLWCLTTASGNCGAVCSAGICSLCVMPNGDLYPCRRLPVMLGNIFCDSIYKIWYKSKILWDLRKRENLSADCAGCHNLQICGGCPAAAHAYQKNFLSKDPHCWR